MQVFPFVVLALLALCNCSISQIMFQYSSVNYTHLLCLQSRGLLYDFFMAGELQSTEQFKFFVTSVQVDELESYSLQGHFNITLDSLHFYATPEVTALYYATALQKYYYKMIWFNVARTELEINCEMIWAFVAKVGALTGKRVGIIGNREEWVDKFGSEAACSQFSTLPLYFSGEVFQPFAGWDSYMFSVGELHVNVCGIDYFDVQVLRQEESQLRLEQATQ